jgi:hypothetical protein
MILIINIILLFLLELMVLQYLEKTNKWGYFPAVNAAWNAYKEDFIVDHAPYISNLFRAGLW